MAIYSTGNLIIDNTLLEKSEIISKGSSNILNSNFREVLIITNGKNTFINCTFRDNKEKQNIEIQSQLTLINCNFTNNAKNLIFNDEIDSGKVNLIIDNCNFINNNAIIKPGMDEDDIDEILYESTTFDLSDAIANVKNSNFIKNSQNVFKIYGNGEIVVDNSTFKDNTGDYSCAISCDKVTATNSKFINNRGYLGAAINCEKLFIKNCTLSNNHEGAIFARISSTVDGKNYGKNTIFDNNLNKIQLITITAKSFSTSYHSGKNYL